MSRPGGVLQVREEAEEAFGKEEAEPSRHAAEQMLVTVSSLKVWQYYLLFLWRL